MATRSKAESTRVLLVEDRQLIREGLRALLEREGLVIAGETSEFSEAIRLAKTQQPHIVLFTLKSQGSCCHEFLAELPESVSISDGKAAPHGETAADGKATPKHAVHVIIVSDSAGTEECRRAIVLGARAVIETTQPFTSLLTVIERVRSGEVWIDPNIMANILAATTPEAAKEQNSEQARINSLTAREIEVIQLLAEGLKNNEIAERLFVSEGTVRHYLNRVFSKLNITDRSKLLIYAFRHGIAKPF